MSYPGNEQKLSASVIFSTWCIMYLSFKTCMCQKHFLMNKFRAPYVYKMHISLNHLFCLSHIEEKHTHMHSDTKWDLSSIIWEFVTKLTLSSYLIIAFKLWYMTQCVGTEAGTLTTIYLPLISRSSVRKETIMEDKHINSNLFHHSCAESWNKRSFTSRPGIWKYCLPLHSLPPCREPVTTVIEPAAAYWGNFEPTLK